MREHFGPLVSIAPCGDVEIRLPGRRRVIRLAAAELPPIREVLAHLDLSPSRKASGFAPASQAASIPVQGEWVMGSPSSVEVVEVVFVSASRGGGASGEPARSVYQYWSKDGHLLADTDDGGTGGPPDALGFRLLDMLRERNEARERAAALEVQLRWHGAALPSEVADASALEEPDGRGRVTSCCMPGVVELVEVIHVSGDRGGSSPDDPYRLVSQLWSKDGRLLADTDDGGMGGPMDARGHNLLTLMRERNEARARVAALEERVRVLVAQQPREHIQEMGI